MQDVPKAEQPVLEKLISLRQRLQLLNKDRTKYIKSQDVILVYDALIEQVQKLNSIRLHYAEHTEENRVDIVLDDVFQLLSLCFMAAGKNFSSPSVYVQAATIKVSSPHPRIVAIPVLCEATGLTVTRDCWIMWPIVRFIRSQTSTP